MTEKQRKMNRTMYANSQAVLYIWDTVSDIAYGLAEASGDDELENGLIEFENLLYQKWGTAQFPFSEKERKLIERTITMISKDLEISEKKKKH